MQEEPTPPLQAIINSIEEMQALEEELRELQEKAEQVGFQSCRLEQINLDDGH